MRTHDSSIGVSDFDVQLSEQQPVASTHAAASGGLVRLIMSLRNQNLHLFTASRFWASIMFSSTYHFDSFKAYNELMNLNELNLKIDYL
jgi:hypothetical protein